MDDKLVTWLTSEMDLRGWSMRELGRRSGLSHSTISNILSGETKPGLDLCIGLSKAFDIPPETVLYKAGLLPPHWVEDDIDPLTFINEVTDILRQLSIEERRLIYEIAKIHYQHSKSKRENNSGVSSLTQGTV